MCVCVYVCVCVTCESLYCREDLKKEYDTQLHRELEALRQRTHLEIEQLKLRTRELYEQENRCVTAALGEGDDV